MTEENVSQVADWKGQSGERWVAYQARLDTMMAVFGQAAIEAAAPVTGERVLDIGCGAGLRIADGLKDCANKAGDRDFRQIGEILLDLRKWIGDAGTRFKRRHQAITQVRVGNARMFDQHADGGVRCQLLSALRKSGFLASLPFDLRTALCLSAPRPNSVFFFPIPGCTAPHIEYVPRVLWITTLSRIRIRTTQV
ncbi:hypothetical protein AGR4A_pAt10061 [Agrobacterium tumefaciens str. B6]|uniref:Uncharacterized protein n=1 Tax=Agrobacterium tumefaciens str. B6 TaxID=1183423 RepID=A0A822VCW5_AGRTU|nr:hypothetical protein AGR4A_pAt10061 [Agrobacterium tumefaciens str. B6]SPZ48781.1 SAM-dependent methyltransferase protein [Agrobacterium tumefaciens]